MVINGDGSGLKFFQIILFQHGTTSEMKHKYILAIKIIWYHFRHDVWNEI